VVSVITFGEGWHNYHHTFPWDYKTGALGDYGLNWTTAFIDFFAYIGWAYDLKQPSKELVQRVVEKLGDGSHTEWGHVEEVPEESENRLIAKENIEEMLLEAEEKAKAI
jgi:stearoyl-CoA desaturase (delta-9 desaturase)